MKLRNLMLAMVVGGGVCIALTWCILLGAVSSLHQAGRGRRLDGERPTVH